MSDNICIYAECMITGFIVEYLRQFTWKIHFIPWLESINEIFLFPLEFMSLIFIYIIAFYIYTNVNVHTFKGILWIIQSESSHICSPSSKQYSYSIYIIFPSIMYTFHKHVHKLQINISWVIKEKSGHMKFFNGISFCLSPHALHMYEVHQTN